MQTPVSLAAALDTARMVLRELLALESVPAIVVFADPRFEQGRKLDDGRLLDGDALMREMVGGRMSAGFFEFRIRETGDSAWFFVAPDEGMVDAVFSPTRTCAGVVLATALAFATARHGCGEFLDLEIRMLDPGESDAEEFIAQTRLTEPGTHFTVQCEQYMRQFGPLNGWPAEIAGEST